MLKTIWQYKQKKQNSGFYGVFTDFEILKNQIMFPIKVHFPNKNKYWQEWLAVTFCVLKATFSRKRLPSLYV